MRAIVGSGLACMGIDLSCDERCLNHLVDNSRKRGKLCHSGLRSTRMAERRACRTRDPCNSPAPRYNPGSSQHRSVEREWAMPSPPPASVSDWLEPLKKGDAEAAMALWERYCERLVRLAREKLRRRNASRRVADEE